VETDSTKKGAKMNLPFFKYYRIPLILAVSLSLVIITYKSNILLENANVMSYLNILGIFAGAILGIFILDLDYFIHTFLLEPKSEVSNTIKTYIKDKDILGAFNYIILHADQFENKTLNSLVFQVALSIFSMLIVIDPGVPFMIKVLVISTLLNTIFRFYYFYLQGFGDDWFWILKKVPNKYVVLVINLIVLIFVGISVHTLK